MLGDGDALMELFSEGKASVVVIWLPKPVSFLTGEPGGLCLEKFVGFWSFMEGCCHHGMESPLSFMPRAVRCMAGTTICPSMSKEPVNHQMSLFAIAKKQTS